MNSNDRSQSKSRLPVPTQWLAIVAVGCCVAGSDSPTLVSFGSWRIRAG